MTASPDAPPPGRLAGPAARPPVVFNGVPAALNLLGRAAQYSLRRRFRCRESAILSMLMDAQGRYESNPNLPPFLPGKSKCVTQSLIILASPKGSRTPVTAVKG